jgi:ADP-dependent NAD(P)H-hydrate dehydratase / NAD(P)H-hydrate epimerase
MRLVKASEMQELDRLTIEEIGIPGVVLMENAARGACRVFLAHFAPPSNSRVLILCGRGNNGGDGYVMARVLSQAGLEVAVLVLAEFSKISGDALVNLQILRRMGLEVQEVPSEAQWKKQRRLLKDCDFIIDGLLGTGLNSPVRGFYARVIEEVNRVDKPVTAIDIPSGLNADTGQAMGVAVQAELTITFGFPKIGQLVFPGAGLVGRLVRIDIGIPNAVAQRIPGRYRLIEAGDFRELLASEKPDIHKGNRGHLLVLAGSTGKTGAATLTSLGALRAGAGLVTLGIPKSLNPILENKLTEAMTFPLPETAESSLSLEAEKEIFKLLEGKTAVAIGPGLSTHPETSLLVRRIVARCPLPMVIDADGLNALSSDPAGMAKCRGRAVLTPHPGEMARLTGISNSEVQADRIGVAEAFVQKHGCCLVLKGARTVVAEPEGPIHINPTGNPALSSGGSGDVLTGLIAGFLARGWPLSKAAVAGVYLHGLAADRLSEDMGHSGILAGELLDVIPGLASSLARAEWPLEQPPMERDFHQPLESLCQESPCMMLKSI